MAIEDQQQLLFLTELFNASQGDVSRPVSMYEIGNALGLDKAGAGALAEELIVEGFAELVSLSGAISITAQGLKEFVAAPEDTVFRLGDERILDEQGCRVVEEMLMQIREYTFEKGVACKAVEEMVIDIKTAEIQLLSPKTKTTVMREILKSLQEALAVNGNDEFSVRISRLINS